MGKNLQPLTLESRKKLKYMKLLTNFKISVNFCVVFTGFSWSCPLSKKLFKLFKFKSFKFFHERHPYFSDFFEILTNNRYWCKKKKKKKTEKLKVDSLYSKEWEWLYEIVIFFSFCWCYYFLFTYGSSYFRSLVQLYGSAQIKHVSREVSDLNINSYNTPIHIFLSIKLDERNSVSPQQWNKVSLLAYVF